MDGVDVEGWELLRGPSHRRARVVLAPPRHCNETFSPFSPYATAARVPTPKVPEGAGVKDWELLHGANPVGAPALRRFGAGIHAQADGAGLADKFRATPDEASLCSPGTFIAWA